MANASTAGPIGGAVPTAPNLPLPPALGFAYPRPPKDRPPGPAAHGLVRLSTARHRDRAPKRRIKKRTSNPMSGWHLTLPILGVGGDELVRIHVLKSELSLYKPPLGQHVQYVPPALVAHMADTHFGGQRT
jgi:hypothetical protein